MSAAQDVPNMRERLKYLIIIYMIGEVMPEELVRKMNDLVPHILIGGSYGSTEFGIN